MNQSATRQAVRLILGRHRGRLATVFPDDTYVVSFPRSGNTWTRFLVGNLLSPDQSVDFSNINGIVPDIHESPNRYLRRIPRPRVLKSHEYFDPRYPKIVYLVRDPRSVAVSYHRYMRKMRRLSDHVSLEDFVVEFIDGTTSRYGTWGSNVGSWLGATKGDDRFHLVRYEDLLAQPAEQLAGISDFMRLSRSDDQIGQAILNSSLDVMQKMEATQDWKQMRGSRKDIAFVGKGQAHGWEDELSSESANLIVNAWGPMMRQLGYLD